MSDAEWKPLIYTCDYDGDYIRWNGRIFSCYLPNDIFDVQFEDSTISFGCLVYTRDNDTIADAITRDGKVIELQHGDLLRPAVVDKETMKRMYDIALNLCRGKNRARRVKELENRKSTLFAELAQIDAKLAELKKEETE